MRGAIASATAAWANLFSRCAAIHASSSGLKLVPRRKCPNSRPRPSGLGLQFGHLQGRYGIAVGQYGASGSGGLNHGWVADNVGRGALGEGFSFNLLTEQGNQILAGGTPSAKAPLR